MILMRIPATTLTLTEYETAHLPANALSEHIGRALWQQYDANGRKLLVEFPSPKTNQQWQITAQGWVGLIPLDPQLHLLIQPKIQLHNLLHMWSYVYRLEPFLPLPQLARVGSIREFHDLLAGLLAQRVLRRARQGFYRAYRPRREPTAVVRGRVESGPDQRPLRLTCRFDEQTADTPDNQIVAYTLRQLAASGRCREPVQQQVRRAYRALAPLVSPQPFTAADCNNRRYTRLNADYAALHALCRFFLAHSGPALHAGDYGMAPFLVNMAQLYERFVAAWLQRCLPPQQRLHVQETIVLGENGELRFDVDLVLYGQNGRALAVLDTKYKAAETAANADVSQIVTYAQARQCRQAVLIYPQPLARPLNVQIGAVQVRTLTFPLDRPLDQAGDIFWRQLSQIG